MSGVLCAMASASQPAPIVGNWDNIAGIAGGVNANVTPTGYTGTRTVKVSWTYGLGSGGTVDYRKNSGTYTNIASGGTFTITAGDAVNFRFNGPAAATLITVSVKDVSRADAVIDTFTAEDTTPL